MKRFHAVSRLAEMFSLSASASEKSTFPIMRERCMHLFFREGYSSVCVRINRAIYLHIDRTYVFCYGT